MSSKLFELPRRDTQFCIRKQERLKIVFEMIRSRIEEEETNANFEVGESDGV